MSEHYFSQFLFPFCDRSPPYMYIDAEASNRAKREKGNSSVSSVGQSLTIARLQLQNTDGA